MSTIRTNTLQNAAGSLSVPVDTVVQGSAKAWVNFNGTTSPGTIRASFNVSSVTKNGTGDYTVNFTTPLVDANYAASSNGGSAVGGKFAYSYGQAAPTASAFRMLTSAFSGTGEDLIYIAVAIFR